MKHIFPFVVLIVLHFSAQAQIHVYPPENVNTGFLYDLSYQFSDMQKFDGTSTSPSIKGSVWNQLYFELSKSNLTHRHFESISDVNQRAKKMIREDKLPLGFILFNYNYLGEQIKNLMDNDGNLILSGISVQERVVFAATSFKDRTLNGGNLIFHLPGNLVFTNFDKAPVQFYIDFDNGPGWHQITPGTDIPISYTSIGMKTIKCKAVLENGIELFSRFILDVARLETPPPTSTWLVEADLDYKGVSTTGDAYVLLSDQNTKLTRPVVVCEGIDFDDSYTWETLYELFNQQNMLEDLRNDGYDLVVLNFHEPLTYIQSNAFLMMKLMQMVNDTIDYESEISLVGPSMGGMVTRYALAYMEYANLDHNCKLWVSFETPHQGANIPLGLQYALLFFKDLDANVQMLLGVLNMPAPKQMLVYHLTDPPTSPAGHHALFDTLQSELASLGNYPENLRKVAISNGRGDAVGQPYNAGDQAVMYEYDSFLVDIRGNMWAVQDNASGQIFEGLIDYLIGVDEQMDATVFSEKPYDNAPGGMRSTFADMGAIELPFGEIQVLHGNHAYIPTISALDIDEQDLFYNLSADPQFMQKTPFDTIIWSPENQDHIFISPETANFLNVEINAATIKSHALYLTAGWNDLSSYIVPENQSIQSITSQLGDNLVILQHLGDIYWPEGGVNTINNWDPKKGYLIKIVADGEMNFTGTDPVDRQIQIQPGWNLIPVLCKSCNSLVELLGENLDKVKIIRDGVGVLVFWPEAGVYSLSVLEPGNAYFLYANQAFILDFD